MTHRPDWRDPEGRPAVEDQREINVSADRAILPDSTVDDTDAGWGEHRAGNDAWLLDERPPHWG